MTAKEKRGNHLAARHGGQPFLEGLEEKIGFKHHGNIIAGGVSRESVGREAFP
jgi:hypothetical protein